MQKDFQEMREILTHLEKGLEKYPQQDQFTFYSPILNYLLSLKENFDKQETRNKEIRANIGHNILKNIK